MEKNSEDIKQSLQTFCDGTSIHGFAELYHAKNALWTTFWILLLVSAMGLTTYQVIREINHFMEQETSIRSEQVYPIDFYPPVKICSTHWIYWLDWEKAFSLNFTKESILYGMSYLSDIYTSSPFDINAAKDQFKVTMALNNFTKIQQFYKSVAKSFPILMYKGRILPSNSFKFIEMFYSKYWSATFLCYSIPGDIIFEAVNKYNDSETSEIYINIGTNWFSRVNKHITLNEYNRYMLEWFLYWTDIYHDNNVSEAKNFSDISMPLLMYADGFGQNDIPIREEDDLYLIMLSAQVNRWLSTPEQPCLVRQRYIITNVTFCDSCRIPHFSTVKKCNLLGNTIVSNSDDPDILCQNQIIHIDSNTEKNLIPKNDFNIPIETVVDRMTCTKSPSCIFPCEQWSYSATCNVQKYSTNVVKGQLTKEVTIVNIVYPNHVVRMIEVERRTWEDFVANIGGLLGVWTGASMMSIIQLFYLCCFSGLDPKCSLTEKAFKKFKTFSINASRSDK